MKQTLLDFTRMIQEITAAYDEVANKYVVHIDINKQEKKIGGSYYGGTQLLTTSGVHFRRTVAYHKSGSMYDLPDYYDLAFKVGGEHAVAFSKIEKEFLHELKQNIEAILEKYHYEKGKGSFDDVEVEIKIVEEVTYGTNFSVYAGLKIELKQEGAKEKTRLREVWLRENSYKRNV